MSTDPLADFAQALDRAIKGAGLTQSELAARASVSQTVISTWLLRKTSNPEPAKVFAVEKALGLSPGHLSHHLGFVPWLGVKQYTADVWAAIEADAYLNDERKEVLRDFYEVLRKRSAPSDTNADASAIRPAKRSTRSSRAS